MASTITGRRFRSSDGSGHGGRARTTTARQPTPSAPLVIVTVGGSEKVPDVSDEPRV